MIVDLFASPGRPAGETTEITGVHVTETVMTTDQAVERVKPLLLSLAAGTADRADAEQAAELLALLYRRDGGRFQRMRPRGLELWEHGLRGQTGQQAGQSLMELVDAKGPQVLTAGQLRSASPGDDPARLLAGFSLSLLPNSLGGGNDDQAVLVYPSGRPAMSLCTAAESGPDVLAEAAERFLALNRMTPDQRYDAGRYV